MKAASSIFKLPPLRHQFLIFWAFLWLTVIVFTDVKLPDLLSQSDYLMTFHCAGYIAAHGLWSALYPPPDAISFAQTPFDKQAHQLLPLMPSWSVAEYMYMPLSAYIFAPFSYLSAGLSIAAWQLTSLAALYFGNFLLLGSHKKAMLASCASFLFIPLVFTLWIGQVGLVFALLPLAAGYFLLKCNRYRFSGLVFALLTLKPQMLVPALFMVTFALGRKRPGVLFGLATGGIAIGLLNYCLAGPSLINDWLRCLTLSDRIYSDPAQGVAVHLATSLPRAILLSQPLAAHHILKPALYLLAATLLLLGLLATRKLARDKQGGAANLKFSFVLGGLALPLVVPHLFLYDLGALVPAAALILMPENVTVKNEKFRPQDLPQPTPPYSNLQNIFKKILLLLWLVITCYCLLLLVNTNLASPMALVACMFLAYLAALIAIFKSK